MPVYDYDVEEIGLLLDNCPDRIWLTEYYGETELVSKPLADEDCAVDLVDGEGLHFCERHAFKFRWTPEG